MDSPDVVEMAMDNDRVVHIPKTFGRYEYIKTIGGGASGVVILVRHIITHSLFACKVVSRQYLTEENLFDRFEQEVRVLPSLNHPYVVHFEEVVFTPELIFLVMEYCSQGDLFSHIAAEGMFAEGRARSIFQQIAEAVRFIHSKDIAHRDLKPNNVLIDKQFNAKLADFGLCHVSPAGRLLKTPCGSPLYAPPEILASHDYDGKAADIWSLGIMLYTMVTGTLPWSSENHVELFRQIRLADVEIPAHLSPHLQDLLVKMLQRDPSKRLTIAEVLDSPWFVKAQNGPWRQLGRAATEIPQRTSLPADRAPGGSPVAGPKRLIVRPKKTATIGAGLITSASFRLAPGQLGRLPGASRTWD
jgi:serine/threonine protein kinase